MTHQSGRRYGSLPGLLRSDSGETIRESDTGRPQAARWVWRSKACCSASGLQWTHGVVTLRSDRVESPRRSTTNVSVVPERTLAGSGQGTFTVRSRPLDRGLGRCKTRNVAISPGYVSPHVGQVWRSGQLRFIGWARVGSKKAYRTIGIPAFLVDELAAHLAAYRSRSDLVLSHAKGGPLDYNGSRRRHWEPAVRASVGEPCTPHDLRHTHVAMLIAEGQSPRYIADRLGHESTRTVLDVYGHLYEGLDEVAMQGLERLRSQAQTDTRRTKGGSSRCTVLKTQAT